MAWEPFFSNGQTSSSIGNGACHEKTLLNLTLKWILWGQSKCGASSLINSYDRAMYQYCVLSV